MAEGDKLGEERRFIFENYANGVDIDDMKAVFHRSAEEIEREIFFVAKKIKEYRFRRMSEASPHAAPVVACDTLVDIRLNRLALLDTLRKLGNTYLSSAILIPKVNLQKIDNSKMLKEANQRMRRA